MMKGTVYISYAGDVPWVLAWREGSRTLRLTCATEKKARAYARDHGIRL